MLLDDVRRFGSPLFVLTGGDPLKRPDLFQLIQRSVSLGLRTTVTPSATPLLTREALARFKDSGISRMAVSLDGPTREAHDGFRGVAGSFERTMDALHYAAEIGLETQVNTTVARVMQGAPEYDFTAPDGVALSSRSFCRAISASPGMAVRA